MPLSKVQQKYAAIDAYVSINITNITAHENIP